MNRIPPKLALINDLTGFGRCSLAVAIPIVSARKVQACPIPTSLFSNHMAFPTWSFHDLTENLPDYLDGFTKLRLSFDGICCGFLENRQQIEIVEQFLLSHAKTPVILDPVMADHGRLYSSVSPDHCTFLKRLLKLADILTPNLTEACLLTDTPYRESGWDEESLILLADTLHSMGPSEIVITGIRDHGNYVNFISQTDKSHVHGATVRNLLAFPEMGHSRPGTGDIFAAIIAADALHHIDFSISVQKAASFIGHCTELSDRAGLPVKEGVLFENLLSELINDEI